MVRSNKAITSSCVVRGASFSEIRRCLAGISPHLVMNGASGGICLAISRASLFSVRFGIWKLRLPHANDSAAIKQWRSPSRKEFWTHDPRLEIRLRASVSNSMSPNGVWYAASNGMCHLEDHIALATLRGRREGIKSRVSDADAGSRQDTPPTSHPWRREQRDGKCGAAVDRRLLPTIEESQSGAAQSKSSM